MASKFGNTITSKQPSLSKQLFQEFKKGGVQRNFLQMGGGGGGGEATTYSGQFVLALKKGGPALGRP